MLASISALVAALGQMAGAVTSYLQWQQSQQSVLLGQLQQQIPLLQAENEALKTRVAALVAAAGLPGSAKL